MKVNQSQNIKISTHSLLAEGDACPFPDMRYFSISTHSLLAEGDILIESTQSKQEHFNPLPPRGGRLLAFWIE